MLDDLLDGLFDVVDFIEDFFENPSKRRKVKKMCGGCGGKFWFAKNLHEHRNNSVFCRTADKHNDFKGI